MENIDFIEENTIDTHSDISTIEESRELGETFHDYLIKISQYPLLSAEDEYNLFNEYKTATKERQNEIRELVVNSNLRLVVHFAKHSVKTCTSYDIMDIVMEGNLGLIRAFKTFDIDAGYKFSTYASFWIRQSIGRGIQNDDPLIRVPVHLCEKINALNNIINEKERNSETELTNNERAKLIKDFAGSKEKAFLYENICNNFKKPSSLDYTVKGTEDSSENTALMDLIADKSETPEDFAIRSCLTDDILKLLDSLTEKERYVISRRFGLDGYNCSTLEEIGNDLSVTRERIRQVEKNAIKKLRNPKFLRFLKDYAS